MFGLGVEGGVDEKHIPLFLFIKIRMGEDGNRWIPFHYLVLSLVFTPLNLKYRGWNPIFLIHKIFNLILFLYNRPYFALHSFLELLNFLLSLVVDTLLFFMLLHVPIVEKLNKFPMIRFVRNKINME